MVVVTAGQSHVSSLLSHWGVSPLPHWGSGGRVVAVGTIVVIAALVGTGRVVSVFWLQDTNMGVSTTNVASVASKVFFIIYLLLIG